MIKLNLSPIQKPYNLYLTIVFLIKKKIAFGFIAQKLDTALNTAGITNSGMINKFDAGIFAIRYNEFPPMILKAEQKQQAQIEILQIQNAELRITSAAILQRLEALVEKN